MDTAICRLPTHLQQSRCEPPEACVSPVAGASSIAPGELLAIDVPRGAELHLRVIHGLVWATDGASGGDHFVKPRRDWRAGPGRALISSMDGVAEIRWRIAR